MKILAAILLFFIPFFAFAKIGKIHIDSIEFSYRLPQMQTPNTRIMVLFGGRNWQGEMTIKTFNFNALSDKYSLILISPSFKDGDYWEPEKWSGKTLKSAIKALEKKYKLSPQKLLFYGYSAGGQCANLFYSYMPESVEAWALNACGVYPCLPVKCGVPAFITCGLRDSDRVRISKAFICKYRENGGKAIWKEYNVGHELNEEALDFARQFFADILEKRKPIFVGEDETMRVLPIGKDSEIDKEFRNYMTSGELKKLWEAR